MPAIESYRITLWCLKYLFVCISIAYLGNAFAQPTLQWQKTFGGSNYDEGEIVRSTSDGGLIISGWTASVNGDVFGNHGESDIWVLKLNSLGEIQWKKLYGGTSAESLRDLCQTSDGGYILAGYTSSNDLDVSGFHDKVDGWVIKTSSTGVIQWQRTLGGSEWDYFESVKQTSDGGYILAGYSRSLDGDVTGNHGDLDFWVVKLSSSGALEWQKSYGGSHQELARSIDICAEGGYIVAGETLSTDGDVSYNHGNDDFWVLRLSESGDLLWEKTFGGQHAESANEVHQTKDGGFILIGYTGSLNTGQVQGNGDKAWIDYWVIKIDSNGELEWQKPLGGTDSDWGESIIELEDGSFVATGAARSLDVDVSGSHNGQDVWVVKLTQQGELVWQKALGGSLGDDSYSIIETSDKGLAIAGFTWSNDGDVSGSVNHGKTDFWLVKLAPETVNTEEAAVQTESAIRIYPNPTARMLNLSTAPGDPPTQVEITNLLGLPLLRAENESGKGIDVSALPPGFYLARVRTASGKISTEKFEKY